MGPLARRSLRQPALAAQPGGGIGSSSCSREVQVAGWPSAWKWSQMRCRQGRREGSTIQTRAKVMTRLCAILSSGSSSRPRKAYSEKTKPALAPRPQEVRRTPKMALRRTRKAVSASCVTSAP